MASIAAATIFAACDHVAGHSDSYPAAFLDGSDDRVRFSIAEVARPIGSKVVDLNLADSPAARRKSSA